VLEDSTALKHTENDQRILPPRLCNHNSWLLTILTQFDISRLKSTSIPDVILGSCPRSRDYLILCGCLSSCPVRKVKFASAYRIDCRDSEDILSPGGIHLKFLIFFSIYIIVRVVNVRFLSMFFVVLELEMAISKPSRFEASCMLAAVVATSFCVTQSLCSEQQDPSHSSVCNTIKLQQASV